MNRLQYLLGKLAEESAEVTQMACKTSNFGLDEVCPGLSATNAERLHREIDDMLTIVDMLNTEFGFNYCPDMAHVAAKKIKVEKYYEYAKSLGLVGDNDAV